MFDYYMWKIPLRFFNKFKVVDGFNVFDDIENYLEYRYGMWRIPVKEWVFTRDDKALSKATRNDINLYAQVESTDAERVLQ